MFVFKVIVATSCLVAIFEKDYGYPIPGHHSRLIIYVPFKVKILHHHNVEKVPVYIQKNIHYHYDDHDGDESHYDEGFSNFYEDDKSYQPEDDIQEHENSEDFNEDYEKSQQWQTTDYHDYDYE